MSSEYVFKHQCVFPGCDSVVEFDDEPWCFTHSPDEGSSLPGFSARESMKLGMKGPMLGRGFKQTMTEVQNVFDKNKQED